MEKLERKQTKIEAIVIFILHDHSYDDTKKKNCDKIRTKVVPFLGKAENKIKLSSQATGKSSKDRKGVGESTAWLFQNGIWL